MKTSTAFSSILKEPIPRIIITIILIFLITCVAIIISFTALDRKQTSYEHAMKNHLAHRRLGRVIIRNLILLEKNIYQLVYVTDPRDLKVMEAMVQNTLKTISGALQTIDRGGTFIDRLPANFYDKNTVLERTTYARDKAQGRDLVVITLAHELEDIETSVKLLIQAKHEQLNQQVQNRLKVDLLLKQLTPFLIRSRESAAKMFHDSHQKILRLENKRHEYLDRFSTTLTVAIVTVIGLTALFAVFLLIKIVQQIQNKKESDQRLQESEQRLQSMKDSMPSGFMLVEAENRTIVDINQSALDMLGSTREQAIGGSCHDFLCAAGRDSCPILDLHQRVDNSERELTRMDGSCLPVLKSVTTIMLDGKKHLLESFIDISAQKEAENRLKMQKEQMKDLVDDRTADLRKRNEELNAEITIRRDTEAALRKSEEQYRLVSDNMSDLIAMCSRELLFNYVSPSYHTVLGYVPEELVGQPVHVLVHPDDLENVKMLLNVTQPSREEYITTYRMRHKEGHYLWFETIGKAVFGNNSDEVIGGLFSTREISRLKAEQQEIDRLKNLYRDTIDLMPSAIIGVDDEGLISQWNREAEQLTGTGPDEAINRWPSDLFPQLPDLKIMIKKAIDSLSIMKHEKQVLERNNETRYVDIIIYPLVSENSSGAVIRIDDITERLRLEEIMVQSEKMMSVGGLAAGMAHEINNPLAGILQNIQVLRNRLSKGIRKNEEVAARCGTAIENIESYIEERGLQSIITMIIESGRRAAQIVDNMLSFARKGGTVFRRHNLVELLDKTVDLASNDYNLKKRFDFRQIQINREYEPNLPLVPCESSKIQQVFLNILTNGAQAMSDVRRNQWQPTFDLRIRKIPDYIQIEIEDNGPGIDEALRKRIFEPFFTTKDVTSGTGLGLSVSYFIITENHNGTLEVDSTIGRGTRFIIQLPVRS